MTDEQRAREVACDALVACCKLPSDTPVDQYHHEPECDALTAAILQAGRYTKAEADLRCGVRDPNPDNPPEVAVLAPEAAQALAAKEERIAELEAQLEASQEALSSTLERLHLQTKRIAELEGLVRDAIEDPDEFETEWNKQARATLTPKEREIDD